MKAKASLAPVAAALKEILGEQFVGLAEDCIGDAVASQIGTLKPGQVCDWPAHCLVEYTNQHKDMYTYCLISVWVFNIEAVAQYM